MGSAIREGRKILALEAEERGKGKKGGVGHSRSETVERLAGERDTTACAGQQGAI